MFKLTSKKLIKVIGGGGASLVASKPVASKQSIFTVKTNGGTAAGLPIGGIIRGDIGGSVRGGGIFVK